MSLEKNALFNRIISEHDECRKVIEQAQSLNDKKKILDWLWKVVENEHHFKEEKLIYPVLGKNNKLTKADHSALYTLMNTSRIDLLRYVKKSPRRMFLGRNTRSILRQIRHP